jgi:hypothetical protein
VSLWWNWNRVTWLNSYTSKASNLMTLLRNFPILMAGYARSSEHKILATSSQTRVHRSPNATGWGRPPLDDIDAEIISVLRKFPLVPVRTIADFLNIYSSESSTHLIVKIAFKIFVSLGSPRINQWAAAKASRTRRTVTPRAWRIAKDRILRYHDPWRVIASANIVSISRRDPAKIDTYDNPGKNSTADTSATKYSSRSPRFCTAGAVKFPKTDSAFWQCHTSSATSASRAI